MLNSLNQIFSSFNTHRLLFIIDGIFVFFNDCNWTKSESEKLLLFLDKHRTTSLSTKKLSMKHFKVTCGKMISDDSNLYRQIEKIFSPSVFENRQKIEMAVKFKIVGKIKQKIECFLSIFMFLNFVGWWNCTKKIMFWISSERVVPHRIDLFSL